MTAYDPLHGPDGEPLLPASVDVELKLAREYLGKAATANIHDHGAMLRAATGLDHRLRNLLAAVDAERAGEAS